MRPSEALAQLKRKFGNNAYTDSELQEIGKVIRESFTQALWTEIFNELSFLPRNARRIEPAQLITVWSQRTGGGRERHPCKACKGDGVVDIVILETNIPVGDGAENRRFIYDSQNLNHLRFVARQARKQISVAAFVATHPCACRNGDDVNDIGSWKARDKNRQRAMERHLPEPHASEHCRLIDSIYAGGLPEHFVSRLDHSVPQLKEQLKALMKKITPKPN